MLRFELPRHTALRHGPRQPARAVVGRLAGAALTAFLLCSPPAHAHDDGDMFDLDFTKAPPNVLVWGELEKVGVQRHHGQYQITFLPPVLALDGKEVTMYGYMTPVAPGNTHTKFLLSMAPLACAGCTTPTGPEGIVEVNVKKAHAGTTEPLAVRGTMTLVKNDPDGLIYRIVDGEVLEHQAKKAPEGASTLQTKAEAASDNHPYSHDNHKH